MYFNKGDFFPPEEHEGRVRKYKENKQLFEGMHWELFKNNNLKKNSKLYVSVNLAGIIAKKSADFLIGDGVQISAGKEDNSKEQEAFDRLKEENEVDILFYESALSNAFKGDSFFRVRYGQEFEGEYGELFDEYRVHIEPLQPEYVFPETYPDSNKRVKAYHIAIPYRVDGTEDVKAKGNYRLQVESHYVGYIEYSEFNMTCIEMDIEGNPITFKIHEQIGESEAVQTGIPAHLVVHAPNYAVEDSWAGYDDLTELLPLFEELNNRLTQVANIMDKHSNPAMAIPPNIMTEDENGNVYFNVEDSKVFEADKNDIIPQYITWNGQLQEAYSEIDRLTRDILMLAEIPEVALGRGDSGTSGSSGLSIKWRMNSLLSKIKRKRKYYEKALKQVFMIAQHLEHELGYADYEITKPKMVFSEGLPKDEMEQTNIYIQKTGGATLLSQRTAMMELHDMTEEQADAEIQRIEDEDKKKRENQPQANPSIFNRPAQDVNDDEEDAEEDNEDASQEAENDTEREFME